jgi:hypothetical protein
MTHTARVTPTGLPFDEGYQSLITFSADPNLTFWETVVGAPGVDGGDPVPTTTMHNQDVHTLSPRKLKRMTPFQVQGKFNADTIDEVYALINDRDGWVTIQWPDKSQFSFPGYLKSFQPAQAQEGNPFEGTIEVVPTMQIAGVETEHKVAVGGSGN